MPSCQINPTVKDYQIAQDMFGAEVFRRQSKALCRIVKKLRAKPLELLEQLGEATIIEAGESIWYIAAEHLITNV